VVSNSHRNQWVNKILYNLYNLSVSPRGSDLKEWIITLGFGPQTKDVDFDAPVIEDLKDG
jgi:hypothetical protein